MSPDFDGEVGAMQLTQKAGGAVGLPGHDGNTKTVLLKHPCGTHRYADATGFAEGELKRYRAM